MIGSAMVGVFSRYGICCIAACMCRIWCSHGRMSHEGCICSRCVGKGRTVIWDIVDWLGEMHFRRWTSFRIAAIIHSQSLPQYIITRPLPASFPFTVHPPAPPLPASTRTPSYTTIRHTMPLSPIFRRDRDQDALALSLAASDMSLADHSPLMAYDDYGLSDSTHMIFDFDDVNNYDSKPAWDTPHHTDYTMSSTIPLFPASPESTTSELGNLSSAHLSPNDRSFVDPSLLLSYNELSPPTPEYTDPSLYSHWLTDPDLNNNHHHHHLHHSSAPIDIPASHPSTLNSFVPYSDKSSIFPDVSHLSPNTAYASLQPLPRSFSPSPAGDTIMTEVLQPHLDPSLSPPSWATQLWTHPPPPPSEPSPLSSIPFPAAPEDPYATQRPRLRRDIRSLSQMWQSSSAPSLSHARPQYSRAYSRRAESISSHQDDRDATIRTSKKRRSPAVEEEEARSAERERETRKSLPFPFPLPFPFLSTHLMIIPLDHPS